MNNVEKLNQLIKLIYITNNKVADFEKEKSELIIEIETMCKELKINIEKIREDDSGTYVDAVDYGRGFDHEEFLEQLENYKIN